MYSLISRDDVDALPDPATTFRWVFGILGPSIYLDPIYVLTAHLPNDTLDVTTRFRGGRYYFFPKFRQLGQLSLTFYEPQNYFITSQLRLWSNLVADDTGQGLPADYMAVGELIAFDTIGVPRLSLTFNGMWPVAPADLEYNQESRQLEVSCSFHVNTLSMITATTAEGSLIGSLGLDPNSLLSSIGLGAIGGSLSTGLSALGSLV